MEKPDILKKLRERDIQDEELVRFLEENMCSEEEKERWIEKQLKKMNKI